MASQGVKLGQGVAVEFRPRALRIQFPNGKSRWFPKNIIHDDSEVFDEKHVDGEVVIELWFDDKYDILEWLRK